MPFDNTNGYEPLRHQEISGFMMQKALMSEMLIIHALLEKH